MQTFKQYFKQQYESVQQSIRRPRRGEKLSPEDELFNARLSNLQSQKVNGVLVLVENHAGSQAIIRRPDLSAMDWHIILTRAVEKLSVPEFKPDQKFLVFSQQYQQAVVIIKRSRSYIVRTVFPKGDRHPRPEDTTLQTEGYKPGELTEIFIA